MKRHELNVATFRIRPFTTRRSPAFVALALFAAVLVPLLGATTASAGGATCQGELVTVNLALGQLPTPGPDVIAGTSGDDAIAGMGGDDLICGFGGNDSIWGQGGNDAIFGGEGDDKLRGGGDQDFVDGGDGADDVSGGTGDDVVLGGAGDDTAVRGGTGDDIVDGGLGDDILVAGNGGQDQVVGGPGNDKVTGGPRPDQLLGFDGDDELRGGKGADFLDGGPGDDALFGGPQPDDLNGGPGTADVCNGGTTGNGAPEDDNAVNCETETNIEGANVEGPPGLTPPRVIGTANLGGPVTAPLPSPIQSLEILESNPEQIRITFQGAPLACLAADAFAIGIEDVVLIELYVGVPANPPDACATVLVQHTMTIALTEPLNGREVVPFGPPIDGSPLLGVGSLGPPLGELINGASIDSFEVIAGPPDQILVRFRAGPAACFAAEAAAFGYADRIELVLVVGLRADIAPDTVCTANLVGHEITITLDQPIDGRPIVLGEPLQIPPPGAEIPLPPGAPIPVEPGPAHWAGLMLGS